MTHILLTSFELVVHLPQLVEVVIRCLLEESIGLLLLDEVELLLRQLVISDALDVGDDALQSLVHLKHLIFGGDLLNLAVKGQRLQFVQALCQIGFVFILLPNVVVKLGIHGLQDVHMVTEGVFKLP
jgi:hypothetical protein